MILFEVNQRFLKYQSENETYRFIHDPRDRISLHIWQKKEISPDESSPAITRFQVAMGEHILEWKDSRVTYGQLDSGEDLIGMKRSPVMVMTETVNPLFVEKIAGILNENRNIAGMEFIIEVIEKSVSTRD